MAIAGLNMMNQRFADTPNYFPEQFLEGAKQACVGFLSILSRWDGSEEAPQYARLSEMLKPRLLEALKKKHQELASEGMVLEMTPEVEPSGAVIKDFWFSFGPQAAIKSTLMPGRLLARIDSVSVKKSVSDKMALIRRINVEYVVPKSTLSDRGNDVDGALLTEAMRKGQMFSVDVLFTINYFGTIYPLEKGEIDESEPLFESERDQIMLRFESPFLPNPTKTGTQWFIADVDNYFTSKVRASEEELQDAEESD